MLKTLVLQAQQKSENVVKFLVIVNFGIAAPRVRAAQLFMEDLSEVKEFSALTAELDGRIKELKPSDCFSPEDNDTLPDYGTISLLFKNQERSVSPNSAEIIKSEVNRVLGIQ